MKQHPLFSKTIIAIICITALAIAAIIKGLDSGLLAASITAIAGLGGYIVGRTSSPK